MDTLSTDMEETGFVLYVWKLIFDCGSEGDLAVSVDTACMLLLHSY